MPKFDSIIETFRAVGELPDDQVQRLLPFLSARSYKKGEFFVRAGEETSTIGYMVSGTLRYYYISPDGREYTRYFCQGSNFVASFSAMVTGEPSAYAIEALNSSEMILMKYNDWLSLVNSSIHWAQINRKLMENVMVMNEHREYSLAMEDARTRYENFLEEFPGIENQVKQYDIATYLGITPVSLSRIRGQKA